ncbi:alpha/beta hydrolase [Halioxenophilus aromaticivorans]|uniref:Alpha/beta hydrolase n=1 Tax=Halioxenophilus aromaticivorans TaxID=1306992 RepID=A0AAV3U311_9ALTE
MPTTENSMQPKHIANAIAQLGQGLGPEVITQVNQLFAEQQQQLVNKVPALATDLAYGSHPRNQLDIYGPKDCQGPCPVVLWVHGGGFIRGDKGSDEHWPNTNVGRTLAQHNIVTAVMNYRLAPDNTWPSGSEDIAQALAWLAENIHQYGGDKNRIILAGTSAGAVHASGYLRLAGDKPTVHGVVLMSGLYGYTPLDDRDHYYYGDESTYGQRCPKEAVEATELPLLVTCSQYDPTRFQTEFNALLQARLKRFGTMPRALIMPGHNHYSMPYHLGTSDKRLEMELVAFVSAI